MGMCYLLCFCVMCANYMLCFEYYETVFSVGKIDVMSNLRTGLGVGALCAFKVMNCFSELYFYIC